MPMQLLGFDDHVRAANIAILAQEHMLLIGPPGVAKSLFARHVFGQYEGDLFETTLTKFDGPEKLVGVMDFKKLRDQGQISFPITGGLVAPWWFLDELYDANDPMLRSTLGCLEERRFKYGPFGHDLPLQTCIGASNYTRSNDMTEAVNDRFMIRMETPTLSREQRTALWNFTDDPHDRGAATQAKAPLDTLFKIRLKAKNVFIPPAMTNTALDFADQHKFTPRRERKAGWMLRCLAALHGRSEVEGQDLVRVLPLLIPLQDGLAAAQSNAAHALGSILITNEQEQKQLEGLGKIRVPKDATIENLTKVTKLIKLVRTIDPVTDRVTTEQNEMLEALSECHRQMQDALGLIP